MCSLPETNRQISLYVLSEGSDQKTDERNELKHVNEMTLAP